MRSRLLIVCTLFPVLFFAQKDIELSANFGIMKSKLHGSNIYGTAYGVSSSIELNHKTDLSLSYTYANMNAGVKEIEPLQLHKVAVIYGEIVENEDKRFSFHSGAGFSMIFANSNTYSKNALGVDINVSLSYQLYHFIGMKFGLDSSVPLRKGMNSLIHPYFGVNVNFGGKTKK